MITAIREKLFRRRLAYRRIFLGGDGRIGPEAQVVLNDLSRFCRATSTTALVSPVSKQIDPFAMAMAEGRREVWNRIMEHLHVDERQVFSISEGQGE